jgi:glycosyltransferase involved in cell wall biosynthesis
MVTSTMFGVLAAVGTDCSVVSSRLNTGYWYSPLYLKVFRLLNQLTDRVFANSEGAKRVAVAAERLSPAKVDVIYNGVDMRRYAADAGDLSVTGSLGIPPDALVVGIVANLRPVKDLQLFLRAAALVAAAVPNTAFVIVGQGPLRDELGRLATELEIAHQVFFSEGRGVVPDYLRRMSVACLTSLSEGFSNAILEYMAAGLPTVATDVGGNAEAIVDGDTGYLVRERTPEAMAAPVIRLLQSEDLRRTMGQRALARCRALFSIEAYATRMSEYYCSLAPASGQLHRSSLNDVAGSGRGL